MALRCPTCSRLTVVAFSLLTTNSAAHADDKFWQSFFGGTFNAGANWNGGVPA